jgi:hypothetical protein
MKTNVHADGSRCREGTQKVPRDFRACCERFSAQTSACEFDVRFEWWPKRKSWVICIPDGGESGLEISFCPYCGSDLANTSGTIQR